MGFCPGAGVLLGAALLPPAHSTLINSFNPSKHQNSGPKVPFFGPSTQISLCCLQSPGGGGEGSPPKTKPRRAASENPVLLPDSFFWGGVQKLETPWEDSAPLLLPSALEMGVEQPLAGLLHQMGLCEPTGEPCCISDLTQAASSQIFIKRAPQAAWRYRSSAFWGGKWTLQVFASCPLAVPAAPALQAAITQRSPHTTQQESHGQCQKKQRQPHQKTPLCALGTLSRLREGDREAAA